MPELFDEVSADAFALPGDDAALSRLPAADETASDAAAPEQDAQPQQQLRDDRGRFVSNAAVPDTEDLSDEPPPAAGYDPDPEPAEWSPEEAARVALERFGIDPAAADAETLKLARSYAEQQRFAGRLTSELGQLRQLLDGEEAAAWEPEHVAAEQPQTGNILIDSPQLAMETALESGNEAAAQVVYAAWAERAPVEAQLWLTAKTAEARVAEVQNTMGAELEQARQELAQRQQIEDAQTAIARETAAAAQQAREDAFVASTTVNSTGEKLSREDAIWQEMEAIRSVRDVGWNVH